MASKDPRPGRANADADPRPTTKPDVSTGKRADSPDERVEQSPTTDPELRQQTVRESAQIANAGNG